MSPVAALVAVWTGAAGLIAAAVWKLARQQRGEALLPGGYTGRHRASRGEPSTMDAVAAARRGMPVVIPRPRSPWGTPEWVDEWTGEHDPVPARIGVAA